MICLLHKRRERASCPEEEKALAHVNTRWAALVPGTCPVPGRDWWTMPSPGADWCCSSAWGWGLEFESAPLEVAQICSLQQRWHTWLWDGPCRAQLERHLLGGVDTTPALEPNDQ